MLKTLWFAVLAALLVVTYGIHQRANATPVDPTWQQATVTIDDEATVAAAQAWHAPFRVVYAADGADVTVTVGTLGAVVGGEATKVLDGDRITGCTIVLKPGNVGNAQVLAHEVGHCFGAHHSNDHPESLMYWISGSHTAQGVTDYDRVQLANLYAEEGK